MNLGLHIIKNPNDTYSIDSELETKEIMDELDFLIVLLEESLINLEV